MEGNGARTETEIDEKRVLNGELCTIVDNYRQSRSEGEGAGEDGRELWVHDSMVSSAVADGRCALACQNGTRLSKQARIICRCSRASRSSFQQR